MSEYALSHSLEGERQRLGLMSELLDPWERGHLQQLGVAAGWRCLEIGSGNGSIACWLAGEVAPLGCVVASDLDTSYIAGLRLRCLEVRQLNVLEDPIEEAAYDLVVARAVLHHLPDSQLALERMTAALKPGGVLLSVEPDMLPATVAEPQVMNEFWQCWFRWAATAGIDYAIGRKIAPWLDALGLQHVRAEGHTAFANGGSDWSRYWRQTVEELRPRLIESGHVTGELFEEFSKHLQDPHYWTSVITFVASSGRKPE